MTRLALAILLGLLISGPAVGDPQYAAIDAHAEAAPPRATTSVQALADYLVKPTDTDREKARAIFTWIAKHIAYDISCYGEPPDAENVLTTRRAVCAGYAKLFAALADAAGLEAVIVHGDAKGTGPPAAIDADGLLNHDWNAVRIADQWHLIDCTWGAGYLDRYERFVREFRDHYFVTPPHLFAYDHLPSDDQWQLLHSPVTKTVFLAQARVQPAFFRYGLRFRSHTLGEIQAQGSLTVTLDAPADTILVAELYQYGAALDERQAFAQREADRFAIHVLLPTAGDYVLRVYARTRNSLDVEYDSAVEYEVHNTKAGTGRFPKMYGSFQERQCYLTGPLSGALPQGEVDFSLRVPGAEDVRVVVNGLSRPLTRTSGDAFSGTVNVEPGIAVVYARFPGQTRYDGLLRYAVR
ncbi:MAG: hypothetical protein JXA57_01505 [Armatimonadetes bacterium]|nr:hypothetical protein [Armatimonadota bacterium]